VLIAAAFLNGVLQFLHLIGKRVDLLAHLIHLSGHAFRHAACHGRMRMRRAAGTGFAGLAFGGPMLALGLFAHFARHLFQALSRFIHAGGAEVLDGLREMAEALVDFGVLTTHVATTFAVRAIVVMARHRWPG
jgi:hypothetical protein